MTTRWIRQAAGVAVVAIAASIGTMAAGASGEVRTQVPASTSTSRAGAQSPSESLLVPIAPCRIVNTQNPAGKLGVGETRSYRMSGDTSAQGGATSCGIPAFASALEISVTAVASDGPGYLRLFPADQPEPNATFLNYGGDHNIGNVGTIQVASGDASNFQVKAFRNPTHVVVDVLGYYVKGLFATVGSDGVLSRGNGVTQTVRDTAAGIYQVHFERPVRGCGLSIAVGHPTQSDVNRGHVTTAVSVTDPKMVWVVTYEATGTTRTDRPFHLAVTC